MNKEKRDVCVCVCVCVCEIWRGFVTITINDYCTKVHMSRGRVCHVIAPSRVRE